MQVLEFIVTLTVSVVVIVIQGVSSKDSGTCVIPPLLSATGVPISTLPFESFGKEVIAEKMLTAFPKSENQVVALVNAAYQSGYRVRAVGSRHSWSPLVISVYETVIKCPPVLLIEMKALNWMKYNHPEEDDQLSVSVGTGTKLGKLLEFLEEYDAGLYATPVTGAVTVGGMIAVGAHGTGIPSVNDQKSHGHTYGTFSNLVVKMTIVSWDNATKSYVLKRLDRSHEDSKAFLTHLGRTIMTSVTLRVGKNQNLETKSNFFVKSDAVNLFVRQDREFSKKTFTQLANETGRIVGLALASGTRFWVPSWHYKEVKPQEAIEATTSYRYDLLAILLRLLEPYQQRLQRLVPPVFADIQEGLEFRDVRRIVNILGNRHFWGPSKNHMVFFSDAPGKMSTVSFTMLTSLENVQEILSKFMKKYYTLSEKFTKRGERIPVDGDIDIRLTGIDDPKDVGVKGAEAPLLSPASPSKEYPHYTVVIWLAIAGRASNYKYHDFMKALQDEFLKNHEKLGIVRPEWSKGWAVSKESFTSFSNSSIMLNTYPRAFSSTNGFKEWNTAINIFHKHDPHNVFTNELLNKILIVH